MFLDKNGRFVRRYQFTFNARNKLGVPLPLLKQPNLPSIEGVLRQRMGAGAAKEKQPNGDMIDLVQISQQATGLVLLFHRANPDAADPTYRRFVNGDIQLRPGTKAHDEEQAVSAHLIILPDPVVANRYNVAIEEIPGLSASSLVHIIRDALTEFKYSYTDKNGEVKETYTSIKHEGVKSASLTDALEKSRFLDVKLSRPGTVDFLDADGVLAPGKQHATLRIVAELDSKTYMEKVMFWRSKAAENGWTDFSVDIELEDKRKRTIQIDKGAEAKEIFFVRSDYVGVTKPLSVCTLVMHQELVSKCIELLKAG